MEKRVSAKEDIGLKTRNFAPNGNDFIPNGNETKQSLIFFRRSDKIKDNNFNERSGRNALAGIGRNVS